MNSGDQVNGSLLQRIEEQVSRDGQARLEGDMATKDVEAKLRDLGYKVVRDSCPILLRARLTVSL